MAFIVETGTGSSSATSYATVAEVDTYIDRYTTATSTSTWVDLTTTNKQRILINATTTIDAMYRLRYKGRKYTSTQSLEWPRADVYDNSGYLRDWNTIPTELKNAVCELCKRIAEGTTIIPDNTSIGTRRKKVGPIEVEYFGASSPGSEFKQVDLILSALIYNSSRIVRG